MRNGKKWLAAIILCAFAILLAPACQARDVTVSAAASLTNAFTELAEKFMSANPAIRVNLNFAASNPLLVQMKQGAPVDVFASADQATMDQAASANVIDPATRRNFALNTLALIVPKGKDGPRDMASLAALGKIALGNPDSVPAGRYAREALRKAELWEQLAPHFVQGESVRQVLDYVARDETDAGFVYGTDAKQQEQKVDVAFTVQGHAPVSYPVAVATTGKNPADAQIFINFVCSPDGQAILRKYGFITP